MVWLGAFIFGTIIHLFWGYLHRKNYVLVTNILKVTFFKKSSHFALFELTCIGCSEIAITIFGLFGIHAKQPILPWTVYHMSLLHHHCHCMCMWTVSHFTGLILFCMHMHIWAWYVHAYQIFSHCDLHFLQWQPFCIFPLFVSSANMV